MKNTIGKTIWVFPDGDLPPAGPFPLKGHESVIILNMNEQAVDVKMTLYFTDKDPVVDIPVVVEANRVRCLRMDDPSDLAGFVLERDTQYAIKLECSLPVVAQYGRLDTREQPLSFYTTPGIASKRATRTIQCLNQQNLIGEQSRKRGFHESVKSPLFGCRSMFNNRSHKSRRSGWRADHTRLR